jgi:uncharacterized protein YprB with RNaseH-like and TPR domain
MKPKILFLDIETSPNLSYVWGHYEQNVIAHKEQWEILCFAYKWLDEKKVSCVIRGKDKNDRRVTDKLHKVMSDAHIIVAHNGDSFDIKKAKSRFLFYKLEPIRPLATVDTKKVAKSVFSLNSNKLDDIGDYLKVGRKIKHTGFDLWLGCMNNDKKSWALMQKYNKQDVVLLEKVYKELVPWLQRHPSIARIIGVKNGCPKCGSINVRKRGVRASFKNLQQQMHCLDCKGWYLDRYIEPK